MPDWEDKLNAAVQAMAEAGFEVKLEVKRPHQKLYEGQKECQAIKYLGYIVWLHGEAFNGPKVVRMGLKDDSKIEEGFSFGEGSVLSEVDIYKNCKNAEPVVLKTGRATKMSHACGGCGKDLDKCDCPRDALSRVHEMETAMMDIARDASREAFMSHGPIVLKRIHQTALQVLNRCGTRFWRPDSESSMDLDDDEIRGLLGATLHGSLPAATMQRVFATLAEVPGMRDKIMRLEERVDDLSDPEERE